MVNDVWHEIPTHYSGIEIDAFVIMPNHIHGIIILIEDPPVGADPCVRPKSGQPQGVASTLSLPEAVHRFTTKTTKRYVDGVKYSDWPPYIKRLWQRNYWEHVIRSERALDAVRRYIAENPQRWDLDRCNAKACGADRLAKGLWQTISETLIQSFKGTPVCTSGTQPG
jgi:putative transposase